jgi:hypothetical protein
MVQKGLNGLSMGKTLLKVSTNFDSVLFDKHSLALELGIHEFASIVSTIGKDVDTLLMVLGVDKCAGLRVVEKALVVGKIRVENFSISMGLAVVPMTLVYGRFLINKVDRTVANHLINSLKPYFDSYKEYLFVSGFTILWAEVLGICF